MAWLTSDVEAVADILRRDGIAAFPTETVYGLGAIAASGKGVDGIFRAKKRPRSHPLIVHVRSFAEFPKWARNMPPAAEALAERLLPGPLTIVLNRMPTVPDAVTGGRETVALRVPSHSVAQSLLAQVGEPVAAPSANLHGRTSATAPEHILADFKGIDFPVLDGGPSDIGIESAIVDLSDPNAPSLLRSGTITAEDIQEAIGTHVEDLSHQVHGQSSGGLERHYSPGKRLVLASAGTLEHLASETPGCGLFSSSRPESHRGPWIKAPAAPNELSRGLYAALRRLDDSDCPMIVAEQPPSGKEWNGIRDRLARAATDAP